MTTTPNPEPVDASADAMKLRALADLARQAPGWAWLLLGLGLGPVAGAWLAGQLGLATLEDTEKVHAEIREEIAEIREEIAEIDAGLEKDRVQRERMLFLVESMTTTRTSERP